MPGTPTKKGLLFQTGLLILIRQRPTLPHTRACSTIGAEELNFRVRNGNGCCLFAMATENCKKITYGCSHNSGELFKIWSRRTAY
jgi:hypothetical protein